MRGSYDVVVRNSRVQYKFKIERNLTVLRGDSATGKTTLIAMIEDYEENGTDSGVFVESSVPCTVLAGRKWVEQLSHISGSIVFIDEGNSFVSTDEFARTIQDTDNYYVIAVRESLPSLPYSVNEIYGIASTTRTKYPKIARTYNAFKRIYRDFPAGIRPDVVVVEDAKSGFEFFRAVFEQLLIETSKGTYLEYRKSKLNNAYLAKRELNLIRNAMPLFSEN